MATSQLVIAIVDDDDAIRQSIANLLSAHGFQTASFPSAQDFLRLDWRDDYLCLLVDVNMPEMSGLELQSRLAQRGKSAPIIIMTSNVDANTRGQALAGGALAFLEKPIDAEKLLAAISAALNRNA